MSVTTSWPPSLSRPCNTVSSMRKAQATISPLSCFTSSIVPATVPPVARRSSTMSTFAPGGNASLCISSVADPYSRSYSTETTSAGSLPSFRTGTKPAPSLYAMGAPKMKPRDSMPTTTSTFRLPIFSMRPSIDPRKLSASLSIVVMSLKRIPGLGKSGTSRMRAARSFVVAMRGSLEHPLATRVHVIAREEAFHVAAFVVDDDDGDRGVRLRRRVKLREDAEVVRGEDARHTAVANDEHRAAGILAMEPPHRAKSALEHAFERLAAGPRDEAIIAPVRQPAYLVEPLAGALADVDLDELAHDVDRQFATARDDERRVQRTRERRRDDAVERDVLERVRERHRLLPAAFGERTIGAAREATIAIRFALAVADEIEGGRPHQTPRSVPASAQPLTRVTRSCFTSRFHG